MVWQSIDIEDGVEGLYHPGPCRGGLVLGLRGGQI